MEYMVSPVPLWKQEMAYVIMHKIVKPTKKGALHAIDKHIPDLTVYSCT